MCEKPRFDRVKITEQRSIGLWICIEIELSLALWKGEVSKDQNLQILLKVLLVVLAEPSDDDKNADLDWSILTAFRQKLQMAQEVWYSKRRLTLPVPVTQDLLKMVPIL